MCGASDVDASTLGIRLDRSQGRSPNNISAGIGVIVRKCNTCGLIYSNPQPVPESIDDHYKIPPEEYWTNVDYNVSPEYFQNQIETAKKLIAFEPGMKALDVGLGLAKAARAMRDAQFDVYGIEPSAPFFNKAIELTGGNKDNFQLASIETAEFGQETFDFITFGAVLEHIYDPADALVKTLKWLKPNGIIHAEIPSSDHLISKIINTFFKAKGTNYVTNISPMHTPYHLHEFTLKSFQNHGKIANYEIANHKIDVCSIYNIPRIAHGPLKFWMKHSGRGMQLTVYLRKA